MHTCQQITEDVSRFLDGSMGWTEWLMFRFHLIMCPPCKDYVDSMGTTIDALAQMPSTDPVAIERKKVLTDIFVQWHENPDSLPALKEE